MNTKPPPTTEQAKNDARNTSLSGTQFSFEKRLAIQIVGHMVEPALALTCSRRSPLHCSRHGGSPEIAVNTNTVLDLPVYSGPPPY